jgi:hypothetical protein
MSELTTAQRADMQADLGIDTRQDVFTNDELDRLYTRAESDYNLAVYFAFRQLLADAAKLHNYTQAQTKMDKSQVFDHIKAMVVFWQGEARTAGNQVLIAGLRGIPPRYKDAPSDSTTRSGWKVSTEVDR